MTQRIGIYPGTFDPITQGHMDIVRRALRVVDHLIIGVAEDTGKSPIFTSEQRVQMVRDDVAPLSDRISVTPFSGLLVDFAAEQRAGILIRGLRAVSDYEYEFQMACMNNRLAPDIETVFLTASENTHFISSRFVKQISRLGGDISTLVSPSVAKRLADYFTQHEAL
jgi:pantetheine-phosphate adenylyltransferase